MSIQAIAAALRRVETVLRRRPGAGLKNDAPACAHWRDGMRVVTRHANGAEIETDLPGELGGSGDGVSPGWLMRAGLAACAATRIAMSAAAQGIVLRRLQVDAHSRSDSRGLFGMRDALGEPIGARPREVELRVRVAAADIEPGRLRRLVEDAHCRSPVADALEHALPITLRIEIED